MPLVQSNTAKSPDELEPERPAVPTPRIDPTADFWSDACRRTAHQPDGQPEAKVAFPGMSKIQKADPTARRNAIAIALAMLVLGACAVALVERYQLQIAEWLAANAANIADSPGLAVAGALAVFAPLLAFSIYMFLFGRRVAGAQRFPPPGYRVVRDTKIVEGAAAVKRGRLLQSLSLALFVSLGIAILLAVRLINAITTGP